MRWGTGLSHRLQRDPGATSIHASVWMRKRGAERPVFAETQAFQTETFEHFMFFVHRFFLRVALACFTLSIFALRCVVVPACGCCGVVLDRVIKPVDLNLPLQPVEHGIDCAEKWPDDREPPISATVACPDGSDSHMDNEERRSAWVHSEPGESSRVGDFWAQVIKESVVEDSSKQDE